MTRKFQSQLIASWRKQYAPIPPLSRIGSDVLVGDSRSFLEKK